MTLLSAMHRIIIILISSPTFGPRWHNTYTYMRGAMYNFGAVDRRGGMGDREHVFDELLVNKIEGNRMPIIIYTNRNCASIKYYFEV